VTVLPRALAANPRLSRWVGLESDGTVIVRMGKVELGQGILTALAQIAADELDVDLDRIRMEPADTDDSPDVGGTSGSMSVADAGAALRLVCANVRAGLVAAAVARLDLDPATVDVRDGVVTDAHGRRATYADLAGLVDLDRDVVDAVPKPAARLRVVGTSVPRLDLPDKVAGRPRFIHDLALPGQLVGRVCRPPSPAARLVTVDPAPVADRPGVVSVVRDGDFLGVVARTAAAADRAVARLRELARWREPETLPDDDDVPAFLRAGPHETSTVDDTGPAEAAAPGPVARRLRAGYSRPFLAHASVAPSCGVARWDDGSVRVWTHSQNVYALRRAIARALDLPADRVAVRHVEGAGCYGHNGADDVAFDAVLLARSVPGRPVQVTWSRADELTWSPVGPAMAADVEATTDPEGAVTGWTYDVFSQGHLARPGYAGAPGLLAAAHLARPHPAPAPIDPSAGNDGGTSRNSVPIYAFPRRRIRAHRLTHAPLRSSSLRSLGAFLNVFAIESFLDELALAHGRDPLEYRLAHLDDPRAREVLLAAADLGGWSAPGPGDAVGHGLGLARYKGYGAYCAVMAQVEAVHEVRVRRLAIAVDVGRVVNPDGVVNQIEGGAIQATSWTLLERVRFDRRRLTSASWEDYPILRFSEVPEVAVHIVSRVDEPSVGAGEAAQGPTAAAIGNAVAAAIGVRVRDLPITTERVVAAIDHRPA
jgi:CO/xanthine dehydrogenase Mo-binding subunit